MKRVLSLSALLLTLAGSAYAQVQPVPALMNFQGRLAKPDGTAFADGTYPVTFSLWSAASGGTQVWTETDNVTARSGAFAVLLGKTTALTASLFSGPVYLQIQIGGAAALAPRQQLVTAAHAFKADTVPDGSLTAAKFQGGTLTPGGAAGGDLTGTYPNPLLAMLTTSLNKVSGGKMTALSNGNIGIGLTAPQQNLSVFGGLNLDQADLNNGVITRSGTEPAFRFGNNGGEAFGSKRTPGGNQYGLDFYTNYINRMTVTNAGNVGIGTTTPDALLTVAGSIHSSGGDFSLTGRGAGAGNNGGAGRALVDAGLNDPNLPGRKGLIVNFFNDFGSVQIDSDTYVNGKLGIGTTTPACALDVNGVIRTNSGVQSSVNNNSFVDSAALYGNNSGSGTGLFASSGGGVGVVGYGGITGVSGLDTSAGKNKSGVTGSSDNGYGINGSSLSGSGVYGVSSSGIGVYGFAGGSSNYAIYANGKAGGTTNWNGSSDARFKTNVTTLNNALDTILNLRGVNFDWKREAFPDHRFPEGRQVGFIAQELEKFLPEVVVRDAQGYRAVAYGSVVPVLVEAVKTQQKQIEELKAQLKQRDDQQKDIAELKTQIAALLAALAKTQKADAPQK